MRLVISVLLAFTAVFLGVAQVGAADDPGAQPVEQAADQTTSDALAVRAGSRWGALIRGDFEAAYALEAPGYRKSVSLDTFRSKFGSAAAWQEAKVAAVTLSQDGLAAKVRIDVTYQPRLPMAGEFPMVTRPVMEGWVNKEGQWWHVSE